MALIYAKEEQVFFYPSSKMLQGSCFTPGIMAPEEAAREAGQYIYMDIYTHTHIYIATDSLCRVTMLLTFSVHVYYGSTSSFPCGLKRNIQVYRMAPAVQELALACWDLAEYTPGCPVPQFPRLQPTACLGKGISWEWLYYTVVDRSSPASF